MRNPWQGDGSSRRGRRGSDRPGAPESPYDFTAENEERVDPVDLLAIRADDELLDALASGRPVGMSTFGGPTLDRRFDTGYNDDQQVLAMLQAWRADVESEPFPEMISIEQASEAIVAGQRAAAPRRRLVPVAAAAAIAVMALSGVAIGASNAQPGDPLWGVSTLLNGNRAKSVEAAYRVNLALAAAQQALAEGRPAEAKAALANVGPELQNVNDPQRREELSRKSENLRDTADVTTEGEKVQTREDGSPKDADKAREQQKRRQQSAGRSSGPASSGSSGSSGESGSSGSGSEKPGVPTYDPRFANPMPNPDPRSGGGWPMPNPANPANPFPDPSNFPMPNPANPMPFPGANPGPGFPGFPGMPGFPGDPRARESQKPSEQPQPAPDSTKPSDTTRPAPDSTRPSEPQRPAPDQKPAPESKPATDTTKPEPNKPATETTKQPSDNRQRPKPTQGDAGNSNDGNGGANNNSGDQHQQGGNDKPRGQSRGGHAENFMAPMRPYPTEATPAPAPPPQNHDARPSS